ncbi:hydratase [Clostridium swellfunianum]|uniref:hydratase n=1 Tax=Clostridium swellfunianum TaxID=1367462 RepID=UPI0020308851|nr:hydratase [Clostridium swellfunianum]MCM0650936.1 hydratase [Clostridium swellfunianum]
MIKLYDSGVYLINGKEILAEENHAELKNISKEKARKNTMAYSILEKHNTSGNMDKLKLKFDSMTSHDITYVGIVQTAKASGLEKFPIPYVLTNCHNTLAAVGGTLNEDDHRFGLSAVKKYGGIFVPPHLAVIHTFMREMMAGTGRMILGSDSHTRYGAFGTIAIGEGGGELVKQLLSQTYDVDYPDIIGVFLTGKPGHGVGPQDVALAIIRAVFKNGYVKNKVMEFVGDGISNLSMDFRNGIDVMTTETTCLSSIWRTDETVREYLKLHGREEAYSELKPGNEAYYDGMVYVDLSTIKPMIALPFHPSNAFEIDEFNENLEDIIRMTEVEGQKLFENSKVAFKLTDKIIDGRFKVDQGVIAGCAGGMYENVVTAANILENKSLGNDEFSLSVYPSSQPVMVDLTKKGYITKLMTAGAVMRTAFCGPCFGAGDTPFNEGISIRHTTRNFPNREGSKPGNGQISSVALMDARSIAATAANGGYLTSAASIDYNEEIPAYEFDNTVYNNRVFFGFNKGAESNELKYGPNIVDWPEIPKLEDNLILKVASFITDPVTTTDELIPSGETSTFRSNPLGLAEFTLSRKDPNYVGTSKKVRSLEEERLKKVRPEDNNEEFKNVVDRIRSIEGFEKLDTLNTSIGSVIYAKKPGDGSAREQAASCQRVLGGSANIAEEYATKRYRSNLINWGMIPFILRGQPSFANGDYIFVPNIREAVLSGQSNIKAYIISNEVKEFELQIGEMTTDERQIIVDGCLINYNRNKK